ncbi:hypothetical protein BABINDRAFT_159598 [Babjeviella inositovora NRRL Y-12698]|uniref:TATA-binding protein interacting (TIP20) domain-containing protein n=1 Tax=Babjeviella inositovora NRRL Y-12698 TaxID=984486 RepID=A0A1E3QZP6_9ASCO|nr:uncharacterized protein BABINDRAFT_159598 [Babjeviella inositovora NRRL Y-12698]ODQ83150.1 hypothetical protein BABINDRAFT_159598 [Babjeviella inositovora NRRL Y-12698]
MASESVDLLLDKAVDVDADLRYMALSDFSKLLESSATAFTERSIDKLIPVLFSGLEDSNTDVQNQAIRCFPLLIRLLQNGKVVAILARLAAQPNPNAITTSIHTVALKACLKSLTVLQNVAREIVEALLPLVGAAASLDTIEVLADVVTYLGGSFNAAELDATVQVLVLIAYAADGSLSRKAIAALGSVSKFATAAQFLALLAAVNAQNGEITRLSIYTALSGSEKSKLLVHFESVFTVVVESLRVDELEVVDDIDDQIKLDELRDHAFTALISLVPAPHAIFAAYARGVLEICLRFLAYDPYGEDEENEFSADEFLEDDEESFDIAWRLRKQAAATIRIVCTHHPLTLPLVYEVVDSLISHLDDSNENVSNEVIAALGVIVETTSHHGPYYAIKSFTAVKSEDASMRLESDPHTVLTTLVPEITAKLSPLITVMRLGVLLAFFKSLSAVTGLGNVESLLAAVGSCKSQSTIVDVLSFYSVVLRTNPAAACGNQLQKIADEITSGLQSSSHSVVLEALKTASDLFECGASVNLTALQLSLLEKAVSKSYPSTVRNKAILALASMVTVSSSALLPILDILTECFGYEAITESAVIATRKICQDSHLVASIPHAWFNTTAVTLCQLLAAATASLKTTVLETIAVIVQASAVEASAMDAVVVEIVVQNALVDDAKNLAASFAIITSLVTPATDLAVIVALINRALQAQLDDAAVVLLVQKLSTFSGADLYAAITDANDKTDVVSKVLAAIAVEAQLAAVVQQSEMEWAAGQDVLFNTQFLGYVSQSVALSVGIDAFLSKFDDEDAAIRNAAAKAVGCYVSRDTDAYLPILLDTLNNQDAHYRRLVLIAVKCQLQLTSVNDAHTTLIWAAIIRTEQTVTDVLDEAALAGECLALISDLERFTELTELVTSGASPSVVYTFVSAFKRLVSRGDDDMTRVINAAFITVVDSLQLENIAIKRAVLDTLVSTAHSSFDMVMATLDYALPLIYKELDPRPEYIRSIQMGPFKVKIDDGLEIRKLAYECFHIIVTRLEEASGAHDLDFYNELLENVLEKGLKDDHDIIMLSCAIIASIIPQQLELLGNVTTMDKFTAMNMAIVNKKMKENSPKQQVEKQEEAVKAVIASTKKIDDFITANDVIWATGLQKWMAYTSDLQSKFGTLF